MLARLAQRLPRESAKAADRNVAGADQAVLVDGIFDNLARGLASSLPRRQVLKTALVGFAGAILSQVRIEGARAASCCCRGQAYAAGSAYCCTPIGVRPQHPISNLKYCPNRVPHIPIVDRADGCGHGFASGYAPQRFGKADLRACCGQRGTLCNASGIGGHDCCYAACGANKQDCDDDFRICMQARCSDAYGTETIKNALCYAAADGYYAAVRSPIGDDAYDTTQKNNCDCCPSTPCITADFDPHNCGSCGNRCPAGKACCGGSCTDTSSDPGNCGSCGNGCPAGNACCGGSCTTTSSCQQMPCPSGTQAGKICCAPDGHPCWGGECCGPGCKHAEWICCYNGPPNGPWTKNYPTSPPSCPPLFPFCGENGHCCTDSTMTHCS
jgi:hypothetical protein